MRDLPVWGSARKLTMNDEPNLIEGEEHPEIAVWKEIVSRYQKPSAWRALWQIVSTIGPYAGLWYLMYLTLSVSWWLTLPLAVLAGGVLGWGFFFFFRCGGGSVFYVQSGDAVGRGFFGGVDVLPR